ncbi:MAG: NADP-dependent oxidoreductase, partial [Rhizobiaceae bacterium]
DPRQGGPRGHRQMRGARARRQGVVIVDDRDRYQEAVSNLHDWVISGDLTHSEHVLEGITEAPAAISMLYQGQNNGKLLVRVD